MPYTRKGFSLVEVLVAISVLLLAVTGTLTVASRSIALSIGAQDQVTASFLAEEVLEFVRNTRDNNLLSGNAWFDDLESCVGVGKKCVIDVPNNTVSECLDDCPTIRLSGGGVYNYSLGDSTIFRRETTIEEVIPDREAIIRVSMFWKRKLLEKNFTVEENLFNWQ